MPPEAELWCVPAYVIERGEVAETILNVTAQSKADLIVLGVRQPSGFPGAATHLPMVIAHKVVQCGVVEFAAHVERLLQSLALLAIRVKTVLKSLP